MCVLGWSMAVREARVHADSCARMQSPDAERPPGLRWSFVLLQLWGAAWGGRRACLRLTYFSSGPGLLRQHFLLLQGLAQQGKDPEASGGAGALPAKCCKFSPDSKFVTATSAGKGGPSSPWQGPDFTQCERHILGGGDVAPWQSPCCACRQSWEGETLI